MASLTRGQAIAGRVGSPKDTDQQKEDFLSEADAQKVEIDGRRQYFNLQKTWSVAIIVWISGLLFFNCLLVSFVGFQIVSFEKSPWLVTSFVTEIFLQVIGLGYIAARFLFPSAVKAERSKEIAHKASKVDASVQ